MVSEARLTHDGTRWHLSVGRLEASYDDYEEALQQARQALASLGGGTILVGLGPGVWPRQEQVKAGAGPTPFSSIAYGSPLLSGARTAPSAPVAPVSAPDETPEIGAEIAALRAAYQSASAEIERFEDDVERDIGLGTLRLEANHTLQQLRASGRGLTEAHLHPLISYVESLNGGKATERAVKSFEKASTKVLKDVFSSLMYLTAKGSVALIAGILAFYIGQSVELGAKAATVVALGGSALLYGIFRVLTQAAPVAGRAAGNAWNWACGLGGASEAAMAKPREIEQRLWRRCVGSESWQHRSLAARARLAAQSIVAISFLFIGIGICGFAGGFVGLYDRPGDLSQSRFEP